MKTLQKSVLIWYSAEEMFALVADVARYPEFLPWCDRARVVEEHADGVTAEVGIAFGGIRQSFTTRNTHVPGQQIVLRLVSGPFSALEGRWNFVPVGAATGAAATPESPAPGASRGPGASAASPAPAGAPVDGAAPGSPNAAPRACRVELQLNYGFSNFALSALVGPVFDRIAGSLVDAFVKRAEQVYG